VKRDPRTFRKSFVHAAMHSESSDCFAPLCVTEVVQVSDIGQCAPAPDYLQPRDARKYLYGIAEAADQLSEFVSGKTLEDYLGDRLLQAGPLG
jgi:hypothetical protein